MHLRHNMLSSRAQRPACLYTSRVPQARHCKPRPGTRTTACHAAASLRTLLIDNYDSYTYNLFQIIAEVYGVAPMVVHNDAVDINQVHALLESGTVHHIILSPGPGSPDTPSDIGVCMDVLHACPATPLLGVCLGHQALAAAAGAAVVRAPEPVHGRLSTITHNGHELFAGCPSGAGSGFDVVRYHSLVVDAARLPDVLEPLAWTCGAHKPVGTQQQQQPDQQACSGIAAARPSVQHAACSLQQQHCQQHQHLPGQELIMALRHKQRPHYGVQFHPESIATQYGIQLLINFRNLAYKHSGQQLPTHLPGARHWLSDTAAAIAAAAVGPPGKQLPPRPWPSQASRPTYTTTAHVVQPSQLASTAATAAAADDHVQQQQLQRQSQLLSQQLGPASCCDDSSGLQLSWLKLPGGLERIAGGSQALFEALLGPPGPDTFWLDSSSAPERARFSFMGGASIAGPLWQRITYKLPPPQQQRHDLNQQQHTRSSQGSSRCSSSNAQQPPAGVLTVCSASQQQQQVQLPIWDYLQQQLQALQLQPSVAAAAAAELPFNFWGGFVGYLGYELKAECGAANAHAALGPDSAWLFADRLVAVDHQQGDVYLLALYSESALAAANAHMQPEQQPACAAEAAQQWLSSMAAKASTLMQQLCDSSRGSRQQSMRGAAAVVAAAAVSEAPVAAPQQQWQVPPHIDTQVSTILQLSNTAGDSSGGSRQPPQHQQASLASDFAQHLPGLRLRHNRSSYAANVAACQAALHAGESYELCLTTAFELQSPPDPWQYYTALRATNPAPYSAWLSIGRTTTDSNSTAEASRCTDSSSSKEAGTRSAGSTPGITVCCSSPERFLQGGRGGTLEAKPIKGTAARQPQDPVADAAAAAALAGSEKERAENLMIVDLLRNDLGKVCEPGSVHVPSLIQLESYATVHQLVSTVRGLRLPTASCVDALRAAFPGGSMTGAPKLRSMAILDEMEGGARGVYSGALGYLSVNDTFDMNIVIRSAVFVEQAQDAAHVEGSSNLAGKASYMMSVGAGGAIVVQSDPEAEFEEMQLKAQQLLQTAVLASLPQQQQSEQNPHAL